MKHLETKREAAERRRVAMMSQGMSKFLEKTSRIAEPVSAETSVANHDDAIYERVHDSGTP